ncbi:MAG: glycosyltransferase [Acidobacteriota bacterium]
MASEFIEKGKGTLRVLVVTNMYPDAGRPAWGIFVQQQVESLRALGHQVDVLQVRGSDSKLEYLSAIRQVWRRTRQRAYHVVHAHYGLSGLSALFRWKTPLVVTLHGSDALVGWLEPAVSRLVCRIAREVVAVSGQIAERFSGTVIPCGVDLDLFRPFDKAAARRRTGWPSSGRVVLFPYQPDRQVKRFDLASEAVQRLQAKGMEVRLQTVCDVPHAQMPFYYSASDAMVLCSDSEGSPTALKEALACGLPVAATPVGNVPEIVRGVEIVEICRQDAESLRAGLQRIIEQPADSRARCRAREKMRRFDQTATAQALVEVYRRALSGQRTSGNTAVLSSPP